VIHTYPPNQSRKKDATSQSAPNRGKSIYSQLLKPWVSHQYISQDLVLTANCLSLQLYDLGLVTDRLPRGCEVVTGWLLLNRLHCTPLETL
jgi:hypothetical protein